jgi:hypothetical protein
VACTFYLGTHQPHWLRRVTVPLFVSRRRLERYRTLPRAAGRWSLDSGGFTELSIYGRWTITAQQYAQQIDRFAAEVGGLEWAAPMDWMCEPFITAKTNKTVEQHQRLTVDSVCELRTLTKQHVIPVLQGYAEREYLRHIEMYERAGIDLQQEPTVGVGSVCRRQHTGEIANLMRRLHIEGLRLHGFGVKLQGLAAIAGYLTSADSLAWSYQARRHPALPGHMHKNCANCLEYALQWQKKALGVISRARCEEQLSLFEAV